MNVTLNFSSDEVDQAKLALSANEMFSVLHDLHDRIRARKKYGSNTTDEVFIDHMYSELGSLLEVLNVQ